MSLEKPISHSSQKKYLEKALAIATEIGNRNEEGTVFVFKSLGDYVKAKEYYQKELVIAIEIEKQYSLEIDTLRFV